jgi:hypothetical protein
VGESTMNCMVFQTLFQVEDVCMVVDLPEIALQEVVVYTGSTTLDHSAHILGDLKPYATYSGD